MWVDSADGGGAACEEQQQLMSREKIRLFAPFFEGIVAFRLIK
jgi:hypothetical protein